jgi:hypothetical protein
LHYYIDPDYKTRLVEISQQKMRNVEAEKNVVFEDDSEEEEIQRLSATYTINGLIRSQVLGCLISALLLIFLVLLIAPVNNISSDYL